MATDEISADFSELATLAVDFGKASGKVVPLVDAAVEHAAFNVKRDLRGQALFSPHFKGMAEAMSYDRAYGLHEVGYEVGPDKERRGGALGNIFFFGGANGGGGTGDLDGAAESERPHLVKALADVAEGLL